MLDDLRMAVRLVRDLPPFLRQPYTADECRRLLSDQLARRDDSFLEVMAGAIFGHAGSPYLALLRHAGIELGDVTRWVRRGGVEAALGELYEAGVHVTLDEFKGRRPIRRDGLALAVRDHAFDNPMLTAHFAGRSGGSRSAGTRAQIDLGLLAHESTSHQVFLEAFGALANPLAIWRSALPVSAGMKTLLRHARIGIRAERWFSQSDPRPGPGLWKDYLFTRYAVAMSRAVGRPLPTPQFTPLDQAVTVARWLAQKKAAGTPAHLDAAVSSAVRVCLAAREHRLDIEGTFVRISSEPVTEARARIIEEAGCRMSSTYALAEVGHLALGCSAATAVDEVHVASERVALLERPRAVGGSTVGALFCSTLHPGVPKVLLNVDLGDYGVLTERACGCPFERLGFRQHLHTIRSYEKLTSEGMHFMGTELLHLVEEVLPARFGGHPTDYQLVEDEEGGLPRVSLVVSPRIGDLDEAHVVATALEVLGSGQRGREARSMMADYWRNAGTLRVVRREPYATPAAKILALHVIKPADRLS